MSRALRLLAGVLAAGLLASACASFPGLGTRLEPITTASWEEPWTLPESAYPTQRHYRVGYQGPEGELDFKLTLYLLDQRQYRMQAALGLGRKLWDLSIDANGWALWVDHRNEEFCQAREGRSLEVVPLAHLPLGALPRLLLGRLPAEPVSDLAREGVRISYRDARGQLWSARFAEVDPTDQDGPGHLEWWSLVEGGEPVVWWRASERGGIFSDRRGQQQVRWTEVVSEPLAGPLRPLQVPAGFTRGACDVTVSG